MSLPLPKPKSISESEVVLSRADWDRIAAVFDDPELANELAEDAQDTAEIEQIRAADSALAARLEAERGAPVEVTIPVEVVEAEFNGAHPIKAWREYRGWTQTELAHNSGVRRDLIAQIETRRKKGSIGTLDRIARALRVPMESLIGDDDDGGNGETR